MRKLILKIFILLLPFFLYCMFIFIFEPYNYYNIKLLGNKSKYNHAIYRMRYFVNNNYENIILGDSRSAHYDINYINSVSNKEYANLAYGGASLRERIDLFWFAVKARKLKTVVFQIDYHTMNLNYDLNRIENVLPMVYDYMKYYVNLENNIAAFENFFGMIHNEAPKKYNEEERKRMWQKYNEDRLIEARIFSVNSEQIKRIKEMIEYCHNNNIDIIIYIPPVHEDVWNDVIKPSNINLELEYYKREISKYEKIYDMEFESDLSKSKEFWDGFHAYGENYSQTNALEEIIAIVFAGENSKNVRIWSNGSY